MRKAGALLCVGASLVPLPALACSGSAEVYEVMQNSNRLGWILFFISLLLGGIAVVKALRQRNFPVVIAAVLICALHPGLWWSAYVGDCGTGRVQLSLWATQAIAFLWAAPWLRASPARWSPSRSALMLAISCALLVMPGLSFRADAFFAVVTISPGLLASWLALVERLVAEPLAPAVRQRSALVLSQRRALAFGFSGAVPLAVLVLLGAFAVVRASAMGQRGRGAIQDLRWAFHSVNSQR